VFDSLDVILRMVDNGLGVAIVALTDEARSKLNLTCLPFGSPQLGRNVVLLERHDRRGGQICEALVRAVVTLKAKLDGAFSTPASLPSR
jgi:DNA-binding transcriptional LysR family regulator